MTRNPYAAYGQAVEAPLPRIDALLLLYEQALVNLDKAEQALAKQQETVASTWLAKTQLIVSAFAGGVSTSKGESLESFLKLYEYIGHELRTPNRAGIQNARKVLETLKESFASVRDQALRLEATGAIPTLPATHGLELTA